jgi:[ribosomal protein S5]-alanine N-acetyltransferase
MNVLETERLVLRHLSTDDAPFIVQLLNDPEWLRFIGDKSVRTLEDAREYLRNGPLAMYAREGFGLYLTALKDREVPIGVCGLIRRAGLRDVDIGFAFLPPFRSQGYALESAAAVMAYGRTLGLERIVAIASPDNERCTRLLGRLGFSREGAIRLPGDADEVQLFASPPADAHRKRG